MKSFVGWSHSKLSMDEIKNMKTNLEVKVYLLSKVFNNFGYYDSERLKNNIGGYLVTMDASCLVTKGYVTGFIQPKNFEALANSPIVGVIEIMEEQSLLNIFIMIDNFISRLISRFL